MELDKIPPQAPDIEKAVVGSLLLDSGAIKTVSGLISPTMFYNDKLKVIYGAIRNLHKEEKAVDILTVTNYLKDQGKLEEIGGATFISGLTSRVGSSAHIQQHSAIIYDKYLLRKMIEIGYNLIRDCYAESEDVEDLIKDARSKIEAILLSALGISSIGISIKEAGERSIDDYYRREQSLKDGTTTGIKTDLNALNNVTGGFRSEQLIIVAARPAMGKTSLAISFLQKAAGEGKSIMMYTLEMSAVTLTDKIICSIADIPLSNYRDGKLSEGERMQAEQALDTLNSWNVHFNDELLMDIDRIYASAQAIKSKNGLDLIIIDYLQLLKSSEKFQNREREVAENSRKAKMMAIQLGVPVILLSQLNRGLEARNDKRPMLSDLRESGAIEQDADIVLFIHRESFYNDQAESDKGQLIIAKHRQGQTGIIDFKHNQTLTKFSDYKT
ncbi:MAG: replicative DNA helicase [Bacteroidales bacterium]|nr:replicative DNA helicase [Bacteroidales bacterium]